MKILNASLIGLTMLIGQSYACQSIDPGYDISCPNGTYGVNLPGITYPAVNGLCDKNAYSLATGIPANALLKHSVYYWQCY
ncbi:hypothetical protein [Fluoribacter gormanii]|uniref:hypothetical protein n=1 Tax=Fluoribacter gormanii TaxID=464 RepID=UPI0010418A8D|nr:hypothetical protein [Fluoribacter gormanii]